MSGPKGEREHRVIHDEVATGGWQNHHGWAAPLWHDPVYYKPVHLFDLGHSAVPQAVRDRAVRALRRLINPDDTGPLPKSTREGR